MGTAVCAGRCVSAAAASCAPSERARCLAQAALALAADVKSDDILYFSRENTVTSTPFAVLRDRETGAAAATVARALCGCARVAWRRLRRTTADRAQMCKCARGCCCVDAVVIAIRGTLSLDDVVTDLMGAPLDISDCEDGRTQLDLPADSWAHGGMWAAACAVKRALDDSRVLDRVRYGSPSRASSGAPDFCSVCMYLVWQAAHRTAYVGAQHVLEEALLPVADLNGPSVVVVGHSLGAGVAALLTLLLRAEWPAVRCWAFAPPGARARAPNFVRLPCWREVVSNTWARANTGALMSESLAAHCASFCTSVVLGKDIVARLTLPALRRLSISLVGAVALRGARRCWKRGGGGASRARRVLCVRACAGARAADDGLAEA